MDNVRLNRAILGLYQVALLSVIEWTKRKDSRKKLSDCVEYLAQPEVPSAEVLKWHHCGKLFVGESFRLAHSISFPFERYVRGPVKWLLLKRSVGILAWIDDCKEIASGGQSAEVYKNHILRDKIDFFTFGTVIFGEYLVLSIDVPRYTKWFNCPARIVYPYGLNKLLKTCYRTCVEKEVGSKKLLAIAAAVVSCKLHNSSLIIVTCPLTIVIGAIQFSCRKVQTSAALTA